MGDFLKNILGGGDKSGSAAASGGDSDFGDFSAGTSNNVAGSGSIPFGAPATGVPFTKWYNIHERHSLSEFKAEGVILACAVVIFALHFIGTRTNRSKARAWATAHAPILAAEYSRVGFDDKDPESQPPEKLLREKSLFEYATYATGRQNVAFMDVKIALKKRFNPIMTIAEYLIGFFFDTFTSPEDSVEAVIYPFDGKEDKIVPTIPGGIELRAKDHKSAYDGFVWALVNKNKMKQLREDRYDVSITSTKDNPKLPAWVTVMSENAEITNTLLTDELVAAVTKAGDLFDYLIISDQPHEKPATLAQTVPRKRLYLRYRLPSASYDDLIPLMSHFVRLPDQLAAEAHFRADVVRKLRIVREDNIKAINKQIEADKAEERAEERDRARKAKRDAELNALDAKAQKKFLEKEKEKELRKANKKQTMRG